MRRPQVLQGAKLVGPGTVFKEVSKLVGEAPENGVGRIRLVGSARFGATDLEAIHYLSKTGEQPNAAMYSS